MANKAAPDAALLVVYADADPVTLPPADVQVLVFTGQFVVSAFKPPLEGQLWPRQVIRQ